MHYCSRCMYPAVAVNLELSDDGVCSSCLVFEESLTIDPSVWNKRKEKLVQIIEEHRKITEGDYDCIIPVGGGKDSYWQAHAVKELGFRPLLVTYHGNNYLPEGQKNLDLMPTNLNMDNYILRPSVQTLQKLNRLAFKKMGDMNWHNHTGIMVTPVHASMRFKVPLVIWGEILFDIYGMHSPDDYAEYNLRATLEHDMRGFTIHDMVEETEGLTLPELNAWRLPTDEEYQTHNCKGIYLGNFIKWDPERQTKIIQDNYEWESARKPFERTYKMTSNLDDMHENGAHDYLKFIKFGYGRCSDHASKDIRMGRISREEGIELVRKYDHVKPMKDLRRWLDYVNMSEQEFDNIADSFRDPRVWEQNEKGEWIKDNIWDYEARLKRLGSVPASP